MIYLTIERLGPLNSLLGNGPGLSPDDKKARNIAVVVLVLTLVLILLVFIIFVILVLYNPIHNNPGVGNHQFQMIQTFKGNVTQKKMFDSLNHSGYYPYYQSQPNYIFLTPYCSASNYTLMNTTRTTRMGFKGWVMFNGNELTYTTFVHGSNQVYSKKNIEDNMSCAVKEIGLVFVDELHLKLQGQTQNYLLKPQDTRCGDLMIPVATFLVLTRIIVFPAFAHRRSPYKRKRI